MLDMIYLLIIFLAFLFLLFSVYMKKEEPPEPYWNILFILLSTVLWFVLSIYTIGGIETGYSAFNSTSGQTTFEYSTYVTEELIYFSYFWLLMGILCIIYLIVTIFGYYYKRLDEDLEKKNAEVEE